MAGLSNSVIMGLPVCAWLSVNSVNGARRLLPPEEKPVLLPTGIPLTLAGPALVRGPVLACSGTLLVQSHVLLLRQWGGSISPLPRLADAC